MAIISETELRRKLRELGASAASSQATAVRNGDTWEYTTEVLYLAYASSVTNASSSGVITNQSDAIGFQYTAFSASGVLLPWRGYSFSKSIYSSGDPTDYIWENITASGSSTLERYYSTYAGLLTDMGDPDYPGTRLDGTDVPWTSIAVTSAIPDTAFFVAEKYTINGTKSTWNVYAVATEETGFGLIPYTITGRNKPTLNSTQWNTDTITAVTAYTGRSYSVIKELGYGTTVVITYDDGKLYGTLKKVSGVATWVSPVDFIDGDLLVDSTIIADKIANNAITTAAILNDAIDADKIANNAVTTAAILNDAIDADKIANNAVTTAAILADAIDADKIANNAVTTAAILNDAIDNDKIAANAVNTDQIAADAITANKILAGEIGANHIAANSLTAGQIATNAITADEIQAGAIGVSELAADSVTADKVAANAIVADNIQAGAIGVSELAADSVTANAIAANTITATEIQADAIGVNELAANSVTADAIAANAVTASEIAAGAVTAIEIAADAVTANKVAANAIVADNIVSDAITTDKIASNAITTGKIKVSGTGAVTAAYFGAVAAADVATAINNNTTTVDGAKITTGTIGTSSLAANAVTTDKISVDSEILISNNAGRIRSGDIGAGGTAGTFPATSADITGSGFLIGNDTSNSGTAKFLFGNDTQAIYWDGSTLSLLGKFITDSNIASIDGSSVSTQTFRIGSQVAISDWNSNHSGYYIYKTHISSAEVGRALYFTVNGDSNPVIYVNGATPGANDLMYRNPDTEAYTGTDDFYSDYSTSDFYGIPISDYSFSNQGNFFVPQAAGPLWVRFSTNSNITYQIYANGMKEYHTVEMFTVSNGVSTAVTSKTLTLDNTFESIENIQLTARAAEGNPSAGSTHYASNVTTGSSSSINFNQTTADIIEFDVVVVGY